MRAKALIAVLFGLVTLAAAALAEIPVFLLEIAPYCRLVARVRFVEKRNERLIFRVEKSYVGDAPAELLVEARDWKADYWGELRPGLQGIFLYSQNPDLDGVFPVAGDQVRVFYSGSVGFLDPPPEWRPLAEVDRELEAIGRRHRALAVAFATSDGPSRVRVVFTNRGNETLAVNRGGVFYYVFSDADTGRGWGSVSEPKSGNPRMDYVRLGPGESMSVEAPARLFAGRPAGPNNLKLIYSNRVQGDQEPAGAWYGAKEAGPWLAMAPGAYAAPRQRNRLPLSPCPAAKARRGSRPGNK